ncbi:bifunctional 4-hydroxy-2-oxoglutarate aldolase/2-dehydro-3-deoxy-phosphogluconate aldolase [Kribbella speibonae]|uniref:Bifunctional 4-hydroxy-2-oxoglutarate aldolase/2-dehydro-3-deoxy-phosphogluconate aldolase n=1 Tax=Kribbella speibonae TaxID=1572660 RepID=A0ABY1ZXF9_9ACTN|nr:bifunctional 4-hydroxy-2-oxoglutarate aldolase/2-dehydro-3-deoxy-phosphogluconate aldolase [Kribbella speibonae]TCC17503.1 bifunctional 4-hydroxy-2-oxoglutarate aldolase/2-dehydro-3-deoxy-phosphogluconate aldolase [Kribbella speibonae]
MFTKLQRLQAIADTGVVLIVRLDDAEEAYQVATAAIAGGIRALEITYSVPNALRVIERLATEHPDVVVGAGTVLDAQAAYAAIQAGAQLLVSPNLSPEMLAVANRYQAVSISGAFTPTEIVNSAEAGADLVKLFPAEVLGPQYVKSVLAPLGHIPVAPTGGVTPENVGEWFAAGVSAVGVGSFVTKAEHAPGDYEPVAIAAKTFLAAVDQARAS